MALYLVPHLRLMHARQSHTTSTKSPRETVVDRQSVQVQDTRTAWDSISGETLEKQSTQRGGLEMQSGYLSQVRHLLPYRLRMNGDIPYDNRISLLAGVHVIRRSCSGIL